MPPIQVIFYQEEDETVPVLEWLDTLPLKVQDKCFVRIERKMRFEQNPEAHTYSEEEA